MERFYGGGQRPYSPKMVYEDVPFTCALLRAASGREVLSKTWMLLFVDGYSSPVILPLMSMVNAILDPPGENLAVIFSSLK